jgi:glucose dehydrogenase
MPWGRSLILGIIAAIGLAVGTPVWMLAQMGRPVDFSYLWLAVGIPALLLALFVVKTRTALAAVVCGVLFSTPIAAYCWILPSIDSKLDYFHNMRTEAILTVIGSVVLMIVATFQRQLNPPPDNDPDKPGTPPV